MPVSGPTRASTLPLPMAPWSRSVTAWGQRVPLARRQASARRWPAQSKTVCESTSADAGSASGAAARRPASERVVQGLGELVGGERIHRHHVGERPGRAGELRQHAARPPSSAARGDELLGDEIHAVVQRRHHARVGGAVERADLFGRVVLAAEDDRRPVRACRSARLMAVHLRQHLGAERLVAARGGRASARRSAGTPPVSRHSGWRVEQPLEGLQALGNALGVVEPVDAHDEPGVADAERAAGWRPRRRSQSRPGRHGRPQRRDRC